MDFDQLLERVARAFDGHSDQLKRAEAEHATSEKLIATAEYELAALKRRFEENRLAS